MRGDGRRGTCMCRGSEAGGLRVDLLGWVPRWEKAGVGARTQHSEPCKTHGYHMSQFTGCTSQVCDYCSTVIIDNIPLDSQKCPGWSNEPYRHSGKDFNKQEDDVFVLAGERALRLPCKNGSELGVGRGWGKNGH